MESGIKNLLRNSLYLYGVHGLNLILPMLVLPYLISTLSISSFGVYSFAFAFGQFAILFVDFGFNISATKKIAEIDRNEDEIIHTFWTVIAVKLLFFCITLIAGLALSSTIHTLEIYKPAVLCSFLMVIGTVFFPVWWFQGVEKFQEMALINVVSRILTYPFIFVFVRNEDAFLEAIVIQSLAFCFSGLFSLIYIFTSNKAYCYKVSLKEIRGRYRKQIRDAWPIFLSNSSISLYTNSMVLFLGFVSTPSSVGVFGAVERLGRVASSAVLLPLNQAAFPYLVKLKKTSLEEAKRMLKKILVGAWLVALLLFTMVLTSRQIVDQYFFSSYREGYFLLCIFLMSIFPIIGGGVLGQLGLLALGGEIEKKIFSTTYMIIGLSSLPVSVFLISTYDEYGAIASVLIIELVIFFSIFGVCRKRSFI